MLRKALCGFICALFILNGFVMQVSAAPQNLDLGDTTVIINPGFTNIAIDPFDDFYWDEEDAPGGYKLMADIDVQDWCNPFLTRDIAVDFTLRTLEYPTGREGPPGQQLQDSWATPGWQPNYVTCNGAGGWQGSVDLILMYSQPWAEVHVTIEVIIWESGVQNPIDIDTMDFWITLVKLDHYLGMSMGIVETDDESSDVPSCGDIEMIDELDYTLRASCDIDDQCTVQIQRDIRISFSITVVKYPQGRTGSDDGVLTNDWWFYPSETTYAEFDGTVDTAADGDVEVEVGGPTSPMEYAVYVQLDIWEEGTESPVAHDEEGFWVSER